MSRGFSGAKAARRAEQEFIDALRAVLGLSPLYPCGEETKFPVVLFDTGNRHVIAKPPVGCGSSG